MSVTILSADELRKHTEGLVLQGCGGDWNERVDGINELLTKDGILLGGTKFTDCFAFSHKGTTCLLFPFTEDVELNFGKLAMWRLQTRAHFGGIWLSDFVSNELPNSAQKPDCPLIGQDGNIFNLLGIAARTLRENDRAEQAKELCNRVYASGSYGEALNIIGEYVNITSAEEAQEGMEMI